MQKIRTAIYIFVAIIIVAFCLISYLEGRKVVNEAAFIESRFGNEPRTALKDMGYVHTNTSDPKHSKFRTEIFHCEALFGSKFIYLDVLSTNHEESKNVDYDYHNSFVSFFNISSTD